MSLGSVCNALFRSARDALYPEALTSVMSVFLARRLLSLAETRSGCGDIGKEYPLASAQEQVVI